MRESCFMFSETKLRFDGPYPAEFEVSACDHDFCQGKDSDTNGIGQSRHRGQETITGRSTRGSGKRCGLGIYRLHSACLASFSNAHPFILYSADRQRYSQLEGELLGTLRREFGSNRKHIRIPILSCIRIRPIVHDSLVVSVTLSRRASYA